MAILQTAERSSPFDPSENVIFQRHLKAYKEASKMIHGTVLELGSGEGYGILELAPHADHYIAVDKYPSDISDKLKQENKITFIQAEFPPLVDIEDNSIDFVVTFQVIEHIQNDEAFLNEIYRKLKPGGKVIFTTPNKLMSLSRNPWHIREYTPSEMSSLIQKSFDKYIVKGIFGSKKVMNYYNINKAAVRNWTRFDILNMQYWLPRWLLQVPYDIINRLNRQRLQDENTNIVNSIESSDYSVAEVNDQCLDYFCIATK